MKVSIIPPHAILLLFGISLQAVFSVICFSFSLLNMVELRLSAAFFTHFTRYYELFINTF